jgi:glutamine amidotransferase
MGWNVVEQARPTLLFEGMYDQPRFYFVHSYHVYCNNQEDVMLTTEYGYRFVSGVSRGNIYGVQFHPEKSHKFGMQLIRRFAGI